MQRQTATLILVSTLGRKTEPKRTETIKKTRMGTKTGQQESKLNVERWLIFMRSKFSCDRRWRQNTFDKNKIWNTQPTFNCSLLFIHEKGLFLPIFCWARIMWNLCQSYHLALVLLLIPVSSVSFMGLGLVLWMNANPWLIWGYFLSCRKCPFDQWKNSPLTVAQWRHR